MSVDKETSIVNVVEDKNPVPILTIAQPIVHELKYIYLGIPTPKDLDSICNIPIALLKPGCVARVDPENPCLGRPLSSPVGIFDGKL